MGLTKEDIILLDLFSGIGGFAKGFQQAGFNIKKHYFSEIDKHAIANYKFNFKESEYVGSVTDIQKTEQRPNIITFGSPCQDFSLAGKRAGMEGKRSSLISEAIRIITVEKPDLFIWENVKGAFSSNDSADYWAIIQAFANIGGYRLEWQLLNTSWVLPQNRERIYLVGHLATSTRGFGQVFPIGENGEPLNGQKRKDRPQFQATNCNTIKNSSYKSDGTYISVPDKAGALTGGGHSGGLHSDMTVIGVKQLNDKKNFGDSTQQQDRIYDTEGLAPALNSSLGGRNNIQVKPILTPNRKEKGQNGRRMKENGEPAFTLNCQDQQGVVISQRPRGFNKGGEKDICPTIGSNSFQDNNHVKTKTQIRRLTEIECERLQGFPDNHTKYGLYLNRKVQKHIFGNQKKWRTEKAQSSLFVWAVNNTTLVVKEISSTQRYKLCGNAVTVDMVESAGVKLLNQKPN